jgi:phosphonate transport system substrate-binding protein
MIRRIASRIACLPLLLLLIGCQPPDTRILIQTRVVEGTECSPTVVVHVTRIVERVITSTPGPPTPTLPPPTLRVYFAPDKDPARGDVYERWVQWLAARTGFAWEYVVPATYGESIQALCDGRADVAWLATPAYLLAHERCAARAEFTAVRQGMATSQAEIMVQVDGVRAARGVGAISSLQDLADGILGFVDPSSVTGYLMPKAMLEKEGVIPKEELFLGGDEQAVLAVYKGEVDAAASFWRPAQSDGSLADARALLEADYPDVGRVVKILRLSEPAPYDPIVFRADLPQNVRDTLIAALIDLAGSEEGTEMLQALYQLDGLAPATDADYDVIRELGTVLQLDWDRVLQGPGA